MPISVTCQCGVRLEIDEKFLGKEIPCPDCGRPLPTAAPPTPPPLDVPTHRRKSGLAVLSLTLALVGGFLILPALAAIAIGIYALKQIAKHPARLEGVNYARAGIVIGGIGLFLTIVGMMSPITFGLDQFLREFKYAGKITYTTAEFFENDKIENKIEIKRLSDNWARWSVSFTGNNNNISELMLLVNTREDAYISCLTVFEINVDDPDEKQKRILEQVFKSEIVNLLGELRGRPLDREPSIVSKDKKVVNNREKQEVVVDIVFGRMFGPVSRRLLVQYPTSDKNNISVMVGACRPGDFERMQEKFREAFASAKQ